jgi:hypothetical protein
MIVWLTFILYLGPDLKYRPGGRLSPSGHTLDSTLHQATTDSFHTLFNSLFFNHPTLRLYIARATDSIVSKQLIN